MEPRTTTDATSVSVVLLYIKSSNQNIPRCCVTIYHSGGVYHGHSAALAAHHASLVQTNHKSAPVMPATAAFNWLIKWPTGRVERDLVVYLRQFQPGQIKNLMSAARAVRCWYPHVTCIRHRWCTQHFSHVYTQRHTPRTSPTYFFPCTSPDTISDVSVPRIFVVYLPSHTVFYKLV